MAITVDHDRIVQRNSSCWVPDSAKRFLWILMVVAVVANLGLHVHAASSQSKSASNAQVEVFISADETATLIETVSDGASLTPMAAAAPPS